MVKVAFLFAGQGSQYIGMGRDLYASFPESKAVFERAQKALGFDGSTPPPLADSLTINPEQSRRIDLLKRCFEGPEELLKATSVSQPAILTVSIAAFEAFKARVKVEAGFCAGLSLGEYTALIAAGALGLEDGVRLVRRRSEIMNVATQRNPGKMAAVIDVPLEKVKSICFNTGAELANINSPSQVVISGKIEAVDKAKQSLLGAGAKRVIDLEVSGAFHSSLMMEASCELKEVLGKVYFSAPNIPVVSNYTAHPQYKVGEIKGNLVYQMYSPVQWDASMRFILAQGITKFYEFGPGKVLKGLMRKIEPRAEVISIENKEDILALQ